MIDRRSFVKLIMAAPAIKCIDVLSSNSKKEGQELPKALLVDPYMVNIRDLTEIKDKRLKGIKIVRVRRPHWGRGESIRKIF